MPSSIASSTRQSIHPTVHHFLQKLVPPTQDKDGDGEGNKSVRSSSLYCYSLNWCPPNATQARSISYRKNADVGHALSKNKVNGNRNNISKKRTTRTVQIEYEEQHNDSNSDHALLNVRDKRRKRVTREIAVSSSSSSESSSSSPSAHSPQRRGYNSGVSQISRIDVATAYQEESQPSSVVEGGRGLHNVHKHHHKTMMSGGNLDAQPQHVSMMCIETFAINGRHSKLAPMPEKDPISMICYIIERDDGNPEILSVKEPPSVPNARKEEKETNSEHENFWGSSNSQWSYWSEQSPPFSQASQTSQNSQNSHTSQTSQFFSAYPSASSSSSLPTQTSKNILQYGSQRVGIIIVDEGGQANITSNWKTMIKRLNIRLDIVPSESALLLHLVSVVRKEDPEILLGWNNTTAAWGYVLRRGEMIGVDVPRGLSRATMWGNDPRCQIPGNQAESAAKGSAALGQDSWLIWITGRMTLQLWSIVRKNASPKLKRYSMENVAQHVLKTTLHRREISRLVEDYTNAPRGRRWDTIAYMLKRVSTTLQIFYQQNILGTTSEMSRLIGIDFVSVLRRGSQFRVESVMMRITKPRNYVLFNPTPLEIKSQRSLEHQALTREPVSGFYKDPVIVLDFQSLYPSLMIAYNLCYSTIIGLLHVYDRNGSMHDQLGVRRNWLERSVDTHEIVRLYDEGKLFIAPSGAVFVDKSERVGVLPTMLRELLNTRVMIKKEMKSDHVRHSSQRRLQRILDARQFALKMTSNVTYGYCSASYSGRMPNSGIADAIVSLGRQALINATNFVHSEEGHVKWTAKVEELRAQEKEKGGKVGVQPVKCENVYGDTDSMFLHLHNVINRNVAHDLGVYMAEIVSLRHPAPVKLKYEKCYHPCILQTKKRYVGNMYERKNETKPSIDAKGIETIRVDQCPLTQKLMEKSLRILFEPPHNIEKVKDFVQRQWRKIEQGRVPVQDFVFCKGVKLGPGEYRSGGPPAVVVARKIAKTNPGAKPLFRERIPYLIAQAHADKSYGTRLVELAIPPENYITDASYRINEPYYIRHTMQALRRLLSICGHGLGYANRGPKTCHEAFDVELWMKKRVKSSNRSARVRVATRLSSTNNNSSHRTITQYFASNMCRLCGDEILKSQSGGRKKQEIVLCMSCASRPQQSIYQLERRAQAISQHYYKTLKVCDACSSCPRFFGKVEKGNSNGGGGSGGCGGSGSGSGGSGVGVLKITPCVTTDCTVYYGRQSVLEKMLESRHQVDMALSQLTL